MRTLLATLALIGGAALFGCDNREAPVPYGKPSDVDGKPVERAMVKDPVCGKMVDSKTAISSTHKDVKYYFCCEPCQEDFKKAPETYILNPR